MTDEMLELARASAARAAVSNVEFLKGTIEGIPLPDASVDVVISNCVLNLSTDKPAVLGERFRVLVQVVTSVSPMSSPRMTSLHQIARPGVLRRLHRGGAVKGRVVGRPLRGRFRRRVSHIHARSGSRHTRSDRASTEALTRLLSAEAIGSAFLAMIVVGSGIAAQRLSPGNVGLQLFENAAAAAAGLYVLIVLWAAISGAHFNPLVSAVSAFFGGLRWRHAVSYAAAQLAACIGGAMLANLMFGGAAVSKSTTHRSSTAHWLAEVVATLGLLLVIFGLARSRQAANIAAAVGAYIGAAYFFTSSTSFANPARFQGGAGR